MSLTFQEAALHPGAILGPRLVTAYCLGLQTGIILNLFYRYWKDPPNKSNVYRLLVSFETVLATAQTALAYYAVYYICVLHFGDWDAVAHLRWTGKVQSAFNFLLAGVAKAVFVYRCWTISARNFCLFLALAALYTANEVLGLYSLIETARARTSIAKSDPEPTSTYARHVANDPFFTAQLALSAALNLFIAAILLSFMPRNRIRVFPRYPILSLYNIIFLLWDALIVPSIYAVAAFIIYVTLVSKTFWADLFLNTIGQLYVFSLFAFLNSESKRRKPSDNERTTSGENVSWRRRSDIDTEDAFEALDAHHDSEYELESFEQAIASDQDELSSRDVLSLSIPEQARLRRHHPEGDGSLTPS